jgi:Na+:H+ antiporter, NhaA family
MLRPIYNAYQEFAKLKSASSLLLLIGALLALLMSNSTWEHLYETLLHTAIPITTLNIEIKPLEFWINDGLMTLFFLTVGLELKREMLEGELSHASQLILPIIAALGGMLIPALFYIALNWHDATTLNGWAIPSATDIAFSLGVLALLGNRVPISLKIFLTALAIIDDLGAILIIAVFYSSELHFYYLAWAAMILALVGILFLWKSVTNLKVYLIIGLILWFLILKSGIHATLAGVAFAFIIPNTEDHQGRNLLHYLEKILHPWVAFIILPIFAFANSGVSFEGMSLNILWESVPLGILLGLLIGKPLGVLGFTWITVKMGWASLPEKANWISLYAIATLCGIGFTMSFFIGALAFTSMEYMNQVRLGVLLGSLLAAIIGYFLLLLTTKNETIYHEDMIEHRRH